MTKLFVSKSSYIGPGKNHGTAGNRNKSEGASDKEVIPAAGMPVSVYLKGIYVDKLLEMYPGTSISKAARQFIVDNLKLEE